MIYKILVVFFFTTAVLAEGNISIQSFGMAKKLLHTKVYVDHRKTIYCDAGYESDGTVIAPEGFTTTKYLKRSGRIEWEHVVPAENFGRSFSEWRNGHSLCIGRKGKLFKGRKCAEKTGGIL